MAPKGLASPPPSKDTRLKHPPFPFPLLPVSYEKTWRFLAVSDFASCSPAKLKGLYPYARLQNWPQIAMATGKISAADKPKISRVEEYWHTVRYRTVVLV